MVSTLRIATRRSPLALWQAEFVKQQLLIHHPELKVELVTLSTKGDRILDTPLAKIGGKGLFVKELETAMLNGEADIAVHSMKDVPMELPDGLTLAVICPRGNPGDAFVSGRYGSIDELPEGAVVGTSSLRRQCQLKHYRPDLRIESLRGSVGTRLRKLDDGDFDAIILASAGLIRLEMEERIRLTLPRDILLPACGQGAVGIECRENDPDILNLIAPLADTETTLTVTAERAMNTHLQGGCQVPIGGFATLDGDQGLTLEGRVGEPDGSQLICRKQSIALTGSPAEQTESARNLGISVAGLLLNSGAREILQRIYRDDDL